MLNTILGFDIGGSKIAVIEGGYDATIYQRKTIPDHRGQPFDVIFEAICTTAAKLQAEAAGAGRHVNALSVSVGGPLNIAEGVIMSPPNLPGWDNIPLKQKLADHFGLPVFVEHDGNAGALAEFRFGAGVGKQNMIFLTLGTGLGAGLILNGKIYRGTTDTAGEVGFIRVAQDGPVAYGKAGSWEGLCSGAGLVKLAHMRYPGRWPDSVSTRDLITEALDNGQEAVALVEEMGTWLGRGCAMLVNTLNPEVIVVGTLGVVLGDILLPPARRALTEEALPVSAAACDIVPAELGDMLGSTAALMAAIDAQPGTSHPRMAGLWAGLEVRQRTLQTLLPIIERTADVLIEALQAGKKVLVFGNGGSAAEAQHFTGELTGRYLAERAPLPAICLSSDSSIVTCIGNDYSYDDVFARQVHALAQPGDIAIGLTTSGRSANVLRAFEAANERGAITIALTGQRGLQATADHVLAVPAQSTARVQEEHLAIIHTWCDAIDEVFAR
ncbi:MAG: hypothetical protein CL610_07035 [Anaerolineaceae bacterium]|nr:hypothetical protein [Anaerolineaceae bacterium]